MSDFFQIEHTTEYVYPFDINQAQNVGYLIPRNETSQSCLAWKLECTPNVDKYTRSLDYFSNEKIYFALDEPHEKLSVTSKSIVEVNALIPPVDDVDHAFILDRLKKIKSEDDLFARQFCFASNRIPLELEAFTLAQTCFAQHKGMIAATSALMTTIFEQFTYASNSTNVNSTVADVLKTKKGVCQDFAHLAISALRSMGFACAYVSGYLETLPPKGEKKLRGADASHAWFSVYIPDFGWLDFDPTNNTIPNGQHIVVARGRDFDDVTPLKGVYLGNANPILNVRVDVHRFPKERLKTLLTNF
ncbi:transglutaminase family protein [Marinicellulosiphila megalodicopiae]|uniref:transglutaminase family protein n=1 Tax=Marinicellulosiphila megalodicopiae TaxID=2724896 RepID=UPI003BAFF3D4